MRMPDPTDTTNSKFRARFALGLRIRRRAHRMRFRAFFAWTARVRSAAPLIYRPQITPARESAWFLLAAVTSNTSFAELGAATLLVDRARFPWTIASPLDSVFTNTAMISSAFAKRNRQGNPHDSAVIAARAMNPYSYRHQIKIEVVIGRFGRAWLTICTLINNQRDHGSI